MSRFNTNVGKKVHQNGLKQSFKTIHQGEKDSQTDLHGDMDMASPIITDRRRSTNLRKFMTEAPVKGSVGGGPSHAGKIGTLLESHKHLKQFSVSGVTTNALNSAAVTRHH